MLAVVPGGSTNVFSRALGRSRDPVEATAEILESLRAGRTRLVSLGTASATGTSTAPLVEPNPAPPRRRRPRTPRLPGRSGRPTRWFVFAAGLGFDAEVIARVEAQPGEGPPLDRRALRPGGHEAPSCSAANAVVRR